MADKKISDLPALTSADTTDIIPVVDVSGAVTKKVTVAGLAPAVAASVPAGTYPASVMDTNANPETRTNESLGNFVAAPGLVWAATSGLAAGMSVGVVYIGGVRVPVSAITSRTFTASKDTYVSVNNAGTVAYSEVANNAAPPTLPANSVWLAKVVTNGSAVTSVADIRNTAKGQSGGAKTAYVGTSESTASTTYTDLATVGPQATTNIGPSGAALVTVTSHSYNSGANDTFMSFAVSGASTVAASDDYAKVSSTTSGLQYSTTTLLTGLTPGPCNFTSKYRVASGTGSFLRRTISVVPQ